MWRKTWYTLKCQLYESKLWLACYHPIWVAPSFNIRTGVVRVFISIMDLMMTLSLSILVALSTLNATVEWSCHWQRFTPCSLCDTEQNRQFVWHRATLSPVSELLWHRPPPCWLTVNLSPDSGLWWSVMAPDSRQSQRDAIWMSQSELESPWSLWPGHSTPHTWITRESGRGKHHKCRASGL